MAENYFEGQSDGEWEDPNNLSWNEADWQQFVRRQEKEVARFLSYYDQCSVPALERLDWVARQMGWDMDDWSVSDFPEEETGDGWKAAGEGGPQFEESDPFTLHRHPVFVVTTGLFLQIRYLWRCTLAQHNSTANALLSYDFAESLAEAEKHCLMALQCMDVGDLLLCIVHMKRCLRGLNLALSLIPQIVQAIPNPEALGQALNARLFDLREVCLRVVMDCRDEDSRGLPPDNE